MLTGKRESENQIIRKLGKDERIPYDLLLLADPTEQAINKYIFTSDIYVLEHDNNITGIYVLLATSTEEIEIKNIAVVTNCQGRGMGKLMLRDAALRAKGNGFRVIVVGTGDASIGQLRLYQEEGFQVSGVRKNFFVDNYPEPIYEEGKQLKDMVILRKLLV